MVEVAGGGRGPCGDLHGGQPGLHVGEVGFRVVAAAFGGRNHSPPNFHKIVLPIPAWKRRLRLEKMVYHLTKPTPGKTGTRPKNRVWGFSRNSRDLSLDDRRRCPELRRKYRPTPTIFTPGIPQWPSRDPIEEEGGLNLYGFVENDGVDNTDLLGYTDIRIAIARKYLELETIGAFIAVATDEGAAKCCGRVVGQTLELRKGHYKAMGGTKPPKDYPIPEGERDGIYSESENTSIDGQIRARNANRQKKNKENKGKPGYVEIPSEAFPVLPGNISTHNIDVKSDDFDGTRMHHGTTALSSLGCPIVGDKMRLGWYRNTRYPDLPTGYHPLIRYKNELDPDSKQYVTHQYINIHYFPDDESKKKVIELNSFVECVGKHLGRRASIKVNIRSIEQ